MILKFKQMKELGGKNYRAENIKEVNPAYDGPVVAIELFFIRRERYTAQSGHGWTVIQMDANGDQVGGARYHCFSLKHDAVRRANVSVQQMTSEATDWAG